MHERNVTSAHASEPRQGSSVPTKSVPARALQPAWHPSPHGFKSRAALSSVLAKASIGRADGALRPLVVRLFTADEVPGTKIPSLVC
eukprot:scaffold467_cov366-Pavlova_lutheri.AAC.25